MFDDILVVIPARIGSTRLKDKPMAMIGDKPMIEHVYNQVIKADFSHVYVATDSLKIYNHIVGIRGKCVMTDSNIPKGTDRAHIAYEKIKKFSKDKSFKYIINVQGDMPFIDHNALIKLAQAMQKNKSSIITLYAKVGEEIARSESNVKLVCNNLGYALYFSRAMIPQGAKEFLYHIGVYGFTRKILKKFVNLPLSMLEQVESLEQLRALENNIDIEAIEVNSIPISVDTQDDLNKAISFYNNHKVMHS